MMNEILRLFPPLLQKEVEQLCQGRWHTLQEIRLRMSRPIELNFSNRIEWIQERRFTRQDRNYVLNQLSEHSLYRFETELKEGFITIAGGHRVGLAGKIMTRNNELKGLQYITSFNIRIAQQIIGIANPLLSHLYEDDAYLHTLIVGPPQSGKTTILRDLSRLMSSGSRLAPSRKVVIIDERSEIAASKDGIAQFKIGNRTDVLDTCPKQEGMMMAIRSLSPEVLIVDEIGSKEDVRALLDVFHAGVTIFCTVHGASLHEVKKRSTLQPLFREKFIKRYIFVTQDYSGRFSYELYNSEQDHITTVTGV